MIRAAKISERLSGDEVPFDMRVIKQAKQFAEKFPVNGNGLVPLEIEVAELTGLRSRTTITAFNHVRETGRAGGVRQRALRVIDSQACNGDVGPASMTDDLVDWFETNAVGYAEETDMSYGLTWDRGSLRWAAAGARCIFVMRCWAIVAAGAGWSGCQCCYW